MVKLADKLKNFGMAIASKFNTLAQTEREGSAVRFDTDDDMRVLLRRAAADGAVLLKNDGVLPLKKGAAVSVFGRVQRDWFFTGYGSGGDVVKPYAVNLIDGLKNSPDLSLNEELAGEYKKWCGENPIDHKYWGNWPRFYEEMPLTEECVRRARAKSEAAVAVIGRSSGEDRDGVDDKGGYYLTDKERAMLEAVTRAFDNVIVLLNIGGLIDMSFIEEFGIRAAVIVWQGGMESGNAAVDLLSGKAYPSGKLTDTAAVKYADYPSARDFGNTDFNNYGEDIYVGYRWFSTFDKRVLYPFGYGLGYTEFEVSFISAETADNNININCKVTNVGGRKGRETVQLYAEKPCGLIGNPSRELAAFYKTKELNPSESESFTLCVDRNDLKSYDSAGVYGKKSAYVLIEGEYGFYLGSDVSNGELVYSFKQRETETVQVLCEVMPPEERFSVVKAVERGGSRVPETVPVNLGGRDLKKRIADNLPEAVKSADSVCVDFKDVKDGKARLSDFTAGLTPRELEALSRGDFTMDSPLGAKGNAGALGGVIKSLRAKGVPPITATDGPSGIRLSATASLIPIGTCLACSFDETLVKDVYAAVGREMRVRGSDILLAPGLNIHRNPLCGRNFEYYSEDPYLSGKIAAAAVRGIQSAGVSACPKHFACNNQEYRRNKNDSRVSERALREIYLKPFEICVKESAPDYIMTSYNMINGVYSHYNYDLCTTVLRGEWGFGGVVMTDWWMQNKKSPEFKKLKINAYRVRAGVDVLMPGGRTAGFYRKHSDGTLLKSLGKRGGITLGELQATAQRVLSKALTSTAYDRFNSGIDKPNIKNADSAADKYKE